MRRYLVQHLMTAAGCVLMGVAVNAFFIPHKLLSGGISGIAIMLYYLFDLPIGFVMLLLNVPLFYLAYRFMEPTYPVTALFGMLAYSFSLDFFSFLAPLSPVRDVLLSCIAGGTLSGIGAAMLYRVGSSSGGTDIIGAICNKYYSTAISTPGFVLNILVMGAAAALFGLEPALYTLLASFIGFKVANTFTDGFDYKKNIIIISKSSQDIADEIIKVVGRGVTFLHGEGAYTRQPREILLVVAKMTQMAQIKAIVSTIDPNAFMIIHDVADVMGRGFTSASDIKKIPKK